jgi:biotin operon repressor
MSGWVKFHRKIEEWEWYKDANTFRLFFHLVMKANHKEGRWQGILVLRGQHITSSDGLANELGLTRQQIRTSLNKLKSTNEITIKTTSKYSLVTVANYSLYQANEEEVTNKTTNNITNEQPTDNQQVTTNKNDKKNKKEKKLVSPPHRKVQHLTINVDEYNELCDKYGKNVVDRKLDYCDNYAKLKNFKSLYLTVNNWLKSDEDNNEQPITIDPQDIGDILRRMK